MKPTVSEKVCGSLQLGAKVFEERLYAKPPIERNTYISRMRVLVCEEEGDAILLKFILKDQAQDK